jgi:hypothetical protein
MVEDILCALLGMGILATLAMAGLGWTYMKGVVGG